MLTLEDWAILRDLSPADLAALVDERSEIAFAMMASMSRHLKVLVDQIEKMKLLSAD